MKMIIKDRGKGKTTGLIYTSEATGYHIIEPTLAEAKLTKEMADKMGCDIPEVYDIDSVLHNPNVDRTSGNLFLLDNADRIIQDALEQYLDCDLFAVTMNSKEKIDNTFKQSSVGVLTKFMEGGSEKAEPEKFNEDDYLPPNYTGDAYGSETLTEDDYIEEEIADNPRVVKR